MTKSPEKLTKKRDIFSISPCYIRLVNTFDFRDSIDVITVSVVEFNEGFLDIIVVRELEDDFLHAMWSEIFVEVKLKSYFVVFFHVSISFLLLGDTFDRCCLGIDFDVTCFIHFQRNEVIENAWSNSRVTCNNIEGNFSKVIDEEFHFVISVFVIAYII